MTSSFAHLDRLISYLPFALDDSDQVNAAFQRWSTNRQRDDEKVVVLWTYCFVMRYFLVKAAKGSIRNASDVDALIAKVYRKIERNRDSVHDPSRYASWVSVVCKHTLINYVKRKYPEQSIHEEMSPVLTADSSTTYHDAGFVLQALREAITRLPSYLQETARLYFLNDCTYEEIGAQIGKDVATVRSYRHKVVRRFREDDRLLAFLQPPDRKSTSGTR